MLREMPEINKHLCYNNKYYSKTAGSLIATCGLYL
ncbi:hypothetical protein CLOL250_01446 [Clostridium sp. L2-50]|nr:hypothetical protein CLOL250_01446 [Clostridium sp. L2-50]